MTVSRPPMPHVPDPFPYEDQRSPLGPRCAHPEKHAYGCRCIDPSHGFPAQMEADLDDALVSVWAGDLPPEQVRVDAMAAYRQREHTTASVFTCPKCRSILAIWVLLGAFTIAVVYLLADLFQTVYRAV